MSELSNIILLDCETGGLHNKVNPITEVALIAFDPISFKEITKYETFVKGYNNLKYDEKALKSSGITMNDIASGRDVKLVVKDLADLFSSLKPKGDNGRNKPIIAGHNIGFDIGFLKYAFNYSGKELSEYLSSNEDEIDRIDTLRLARLKWDTGKATDKFNLTACCKRVGIEIISAHRAMNDVKPNKKLLEYFLTELRGKIDIKKGKVISKVSDRDDESIITDGQKFRQGFQF